MRELIEFWLFIAFVGLLLLLRFDASRFGVAEYDDETTHAGWRGWLRRLSFYALGIALVLLIYIIYLQPITVLHLDLGADRQQALLFGLIYGLGGTLVAFGFAWYRYRRFRLPGARAYPGGIINAFCTAFIDEAVFRGVILGLLLAWGWSPALAIAFETILYGLATRLGAPGRSRMMLLISMGMGVVGGLLVVETLGIGAAVLGHAITRFAIFLATGHAGSVRPSGWEPEELASWALPPSGWDIVSEPDAHPTTIGPGAAIPAGFRLPPGAPAGGPPGAWPPGSGAPWPQPAPGWTEAPGGPWAGVPADPWASGPSEPWGSGRPVAWGPADQAGPPPDAWGPGDASMPPAATWGSGDAPGPGPDPGPWIPEPGAPPPPDGPWGPPPEASWPSDPWPGGPGDGGPRDRGTRRAR